MKYILLAIPFLNNKAGDLRVYELGVLYPAGYSRMFLTYEATVCIHFQEIIYCWCLSIKFAHCAT